MDVESVLEAVGPRLRTLRGEQGVTLAGLAEQTGISVSTLSRLESGGRKPTLELLLPIARAYGMALDELLETTTATDPRVPQRAVTNGPLTMIPLSRRAGGLQAYKMILAPGSQRREPDPRTHEGYEWLYVLDGRLRMVLGDHDIVLEPGEVAEFDTRLPHWFGGADGHRVEMLSIFSREGEKMHVRAASTRNEQKR
ncbi:helix-turn-helix domain-containing protein [Nocardioides sp. CFH 31398]|uniref:helix-turn-helix domain-containing protein n=1 Tax=Nocardioides sp. CFH 31398 TaxID=2919579 RepID=UPI001F06007B|nr:XRE family transcriptional regulator [Nocardioides sp. CFH 31398]MCH1866870.1 XRE family transcriptional regulator [Nocardioides sp. CFH 31398]